MLFSSITFLWFFLPVVFIVHLLLPAKCKNYFLLLASLLFYSWGEPVYIFLMIFSILFNYFLAIIIDVSENKRIKKIVFVTDVLANISLLWYFKYYTSFAQLTNTFLKKDIISVKEVILPIGISFYTFQILSYIIDVYFKKCDVQKNIVNFALYVCFFPQLIAGPIVQYKEISAQIQKRSLSVSQTEAGIRRFIWGLSKKVLLANSLAEVADSIFLLPHNQVDTIWLWVGVLLYTLQIYYDFSGYSDMAIGLGKMFGFEFAENFNYPYISSSIQEFWRRWHISLSSWFREYVYIPLGGNRKGEVNTYRNLIIVFLLTGIWHGATLNFLVWGLFHGFFILIERIGFGEVLKRNKIKILNHIYTMFIVSVGWAMFRCDSLTEAKELLRSLFSWKMLHTYEWYDFFSVRAIFLTVVAVLLVGFMQEGIRKKKTVLAANKLIYLSEVLFQGILLILCIVSLIAGQYNPFIYFKF